MTGKGALHAPAPIAILYMENFLILIIVVFSSNRQSLHAYNSISHKKGYYYNKNARLLY